jgi:hypothetical protein
MKKLLFVTLLGFALISSAEGLPNEMYMANSAGGFVVLTTEPCVFDKVSKEYPYRAYATESSDIVLHEGCWVNPNTDEVPTTIMATSEGAPPAPTLYIIHIVNTWWKEGGYATFLQERFTPEKRGFLSNGNKP